MIPSKQFKIILEILVGKRLCLKIFERGRVASIVAITLLIVIEVILSMPIPYLIYQKLGNKIYHN